MAKLQLKSEQQLLGDMARVILARTGLNDLNPGSVLLTLLQAAAQEDFAQYYQMLQIVRNYNLETTTGSDLDNRAFEYGLTRRASKASTGKITILREEGFTKISTGFYTGFRARIAGDTVLPVNDASDFPSSGTLIIGRSTANEEEVSYSVAPVNNTNYFDITLDAPLTNDHSLEESIILKQGVDTNISAGTLVRVPSTGRSEEISFTTTRDVQILAGEESVTDVDVKCTVPGIQGNIGVNSITGTNAFPSPPFPGARATNESSFSNGLDRETDTKLRNRIKSFIQGLTQSTKAGISNAIDGLTDPTTAKTLVSSNIILPDNVGLPVKIYIDDGTGFEPTFANQGQEVILDAANGGETRLQLDLFPLVKAQIETGRAEPFDMSTNGLTLQLNVGAQSETITFFTNQFSIPEAGSSEEVVAAINNTSNLIEARTSQVGKRVVITAKTDANENITVTGGTANTADKLNFPTEERQTFYLYKNDKLLSKDGETAFIDAGNTATYDFSGSDQDLLVVVDGKTANEQTVTISESDFASPAAAAAATAAQVAALINDQLAGAIASDNNGRVRITSNTSLSSSSKIQINASDAATTLGFSTVEVVGSNRDYTLNPELGVIELNEPLIENDRVTAGTRKTRAFLTASIAGDYSFVGGENLLVEIDGGSSQVITFATQSNSPAAAVAAEINTQLEGGTAEVRTIGLDEFVEIRTNTFGPSGSIEVLSGGAANVFLGFDEDTLVTNLDSHVAFVVAQNTGPYAFVEGQTLVVVLDKDPAGKTFVITMHYDSAVTSGASTVQFAASGLITIFTEDDVLNDFWVVMKSGDNTISGTVETVQNPTGTTYRYIYDAPPTNFEDFAVGDQASFSDLDQEANNGNFLVTGISVQNTVYADVLDKDLDTPNALTPSPGDRYIVAPTANTALALAVLDKDVSNPSALTPSSGDRYIIDEAANNVTLSPVQDLLTDSAAATTTHGFRYIIDGTGLNDWAGHDNEIAQYNGVGTPGWIFITPSDEDVAQDLDSGNFYQFDNGSGTWSQNDWGGKAGRVAEWNGSSWDFTIPSDNEVRTVTDEALKYQYDISSGLWAQNDWGGNATDIAEWNGASWDFTTPATNDVTDVDDESLTYQFNGTSWTAFAFYVEVSNSAGVIESGSSGTGLIGQRRQVSDYNATTGAITVSSGFRATPSGADDLVLLPGTAVNVRDFFNNQKVTSLSARANIELVEQGTKVQISSKLNGSNGYVQVTGGPANTILQFSTTEIRGLQAYSYYVGLIKLVHRTIYGDETDLVAYPGVGAAGIKFQILPPTVQEVSFSLDITLSEGISLSSVENSVKSAVISYVNGLGVGEKVILSQIIDSVVELDGVSDVDILSPSVNVPIAQNELARTKASIISIS